MSQVRKRAELELLVAANQHKIHAVCQICGSSKPLFLHHILRRSLYMKHEIVDLMPLPMHGLLCNQCNMNQTEGFIADSPEGRARLLSINATIFGIHAIEQAFFDWDEISPNGHNPEVVDFDRVRMIYNQEYGDK